jgi:hypothetical protein
MSSEIVEYSGYLSYATRSPEQLDAIRERLTRARLSVDLQPGGLEIEYAGRDSGRNLVAALSAIAPLIGDAEGEIVCQIDTSSPTPDYEFYFIQNGRLYRQRAHLVRDEAEAVEAAKALPVAHRVA